MSAGPEFRDRLLALVLLLALTAAAHAGRSTSLTPAHGATSISALPEQFGTFDTREQAQIAALRSIRERKVETGGAILFNPASGQYAYTATVGQEDAAHFWAAVRVPAGWQLDSLYHTHPQGPQSSLFSEDDISTAQRLKVPSYVLSRYDNRIRRFDPASSRVSKSVTGEYSAGELLDETAPALKERSAHPPRTVSASWFAHTAASCRVTPGAPADAARCLGAVLGGGLP